MKTVARGWGQERSRRQRGGMKDPGVVVDGIVLCVVWWHIRDSIVKIQRTV